MADWHPANGAELQTAITSAALGDTIYLTHGVTYSRAGSFTLPDKGAGTSFITITTDRIDLLPQKLSDYPRNWRYSDRTAYRVTQAEAANMPKIVGIDTGFVINFPNRSHHWKLYGIEITGSNDVFFQTIVQVAGYEPTLADFNHHITFDHCYIHPQDEIGDLTNGFPYRHAEYAMLIGGNDWIIQNNAIQGFAGYVNGTSQPLNSYAVLYGLGTGNVLIQNNLLETSGNNLWLGGGGGGFPFSDSGSTLAAGATNTAATLNSMPANPIAVNDLASIRITGLSDILMSLLDDPDYNAPTQIQAGFGVGRITGVSGNDITYTDGLTSGVYFRGFRIKFKSGTSDGTFTITADGQTTSAITFPAAIVTGATNATPIEITSASHGYTTGQEVRVNEVGGNTAANGNFIITVTGTNTFTLNGSVGNGAYTSGGKVCNRTNLQNNIRSALEALSNIAPADLDIVSGYQLYVGGDVGYYPKLTTNLAFGVEVMFAKSWPTLMRAGVEFTVDGTGLTGTGNIGIRVEQAWTEGYTLVHPSIVPDTNAAIQWDGLVIDGVTIRQNIIAKQPEWHIYLNKGFGEMKSGRNYLFEGNIWWGEYTGMILETKNQAGDAPWSVVENMEFRYNLWTHSAGPIAIAPTDGSNRTLQGNGYYIHDNIAVGAPSGAFDPAYWGNSTLGGSNIRVEHNTFFNPGRFVFAVVGTTYDGPEFAGFSQLRQWTFKNNICRYSYNFWGGYNDTPTSSPLYNHGDIRDYLPDFAANDNVIIDDRNYYALYGDFFSFFAIHTTNNWRVAGYSDVGFLNGGINETTFIDPRLNPSSIYAAGNAKDATDGKDMGADVPALITAMGFNPFTGEPAAPSVKLIAICL